jgi:hypothetical protein
VNIAAMNFYFLLACIARPEGPLAQAHVRRCKHCQTAPLGDLCAVAEHLYSVHCAAMYRAAKHGGFIRE